METEEEAAARRRAGFEVMNGLGEFVLSMPSFAADFVEMPAFTIGSHMAMAISAAMAYPEWGQAVAALTVVPSLEPGVREEGIRELVAYVPVGGVS